MFDRGSLRRRGLVSIGCHLPYNPRLVSRAKYLRRNMTAAESKLWGWFLENMSDRVLRQRPIDNYIVDFYCAKHTLVIEVDGESHDTNNAKEYDDVRDTILRGYGLKVLRLRNKEVLENFEIALKKIKDCFNG